jgi:hypothetical protein
MAVPISPRFWAAWVSLCLTCFQLSALKSTSVIQNTSTELQKQIDENLEMLLFSPNPPRPCTFDILWKKFGSTKSEKILDDGNSCWELRKEILNIPVEAILNRKTHALIGLGHHGAVSKVLIKYDVHQHQVCEVVVKTDKCHSIKGTRGGFQSCIAPDAMNRIEESYLGAEFMGSLPFASQRRVGIKSEGFLPVWGVITKKGGLPSRKPHNEWDGRTHPDPDVIGIVLPLTKFTPLNSGAYINTVFDTLDEKTRNYITKDISSIVKTVMPAANALKHFAGLGLSYQGIHMEDVGLLVDNDTHGNIRNATAMLYDNTHTGYEPEKTCKSDVQEACNYCPEPWFHAADRVSKTKRMTGIKRDLDNFIIHFLQPFMRNSVDKERTMKLFHSLKHCEDHSCMITKLEDAGGNSV